MKKILALILSVAMILSSVPFAFAAEGDGEQTVINVGNGSVIFTADGVILDGQTIPEDPDGYVLTGSSTGVDTVIKFENYSGAEHTFNVTFRDLYVSPSSYSTALTIRSNYVTRLNIKIEGTNTFSMSNWCLFAGMSGGFEKPVLTYVYIDCPEGNSLNISRSDDEPYYYVSAGDSYTRVYMNDVPIGTDGHAHSRSDEDVLTCRGYKCNTCSYYYDLGEFGDHFGGEQTCKGYMCEFCYNWFGEPGDHNTVPTCKGDYCPSCYEYFGEPDLTKHSWDYGYCYLCGASFPDDAECEHDWSSSGTCRRCGAPCGHEEVSDSGVCQICDCEFNFALKSLGKELRFYQYFGDAYDEAVASDEIILLRDIDGFSFAEHELIKEITVDLNGHGWCSYDYLRVYDFITFTDSVGNGYFSGFIYLYSPAAFKGGRYSEILIKDAEKVANLACCLEDCYLFYDYSNDEIIDAENNTYGSNYVEVKTNHTLSDTQTCGGYKCTVCGENVGEGVGEHSFGSELTCSGYECLICGEFSAEKGSLTAHKGTTQTCLGFRCEICDKWFGEKGSHSGGTQTCMGYKCDVCKEWYGEIGEHSGGTQTCDGYKCEICYEWYGEPKPHSSGENNTCKGYQCQDCGVWFGEKGEHDFNEDDICTLCYYKDSEEIVIVLTESYGDSWSGNAVKLHSVAADGTESLIDTYAVEDSNVKKSVITLPAVTPSITRFYWVSGDYPDECGLYLIYKGKELYSNNTFSNDDDDKLLYTLRFVEGASEFSTIQNSLITELKEEYGEAAWNEFAERTGDRYDAQLGQILSKASVISGLYEDNAEILTEIENELKALYEKIDKCLSGNHNIEGATQDLIRPVQNPDGTWAKGSIVAACNNCGLSVVIQEVERDHEGYAAFEEAASRMETLLNNGQLTDSALNGYTTSFEYLRNAAYSTVFTNIETAMSLITEDLNSYIAEVDKGLADGTMRKADLTDIISIFNQIEAIIGGDPDKIITSAVGYYYGPYYYIQAQKVNSNLSQADYDRNMAEYDFENQLLTLLAGLKDGSMLKADYIEVDAYVVMVEEMLTKKNFNDDIKTELEAIKADIATAKANSLSTRNDAQRLLNAILALMDKISGCLENKHTADCEVTSPAKCEVNAIESGTCEYCGEAFEREVDGTALTHSFTTYKVTAAATCGKAGKEIASCDHGCGATKERAVSATGKHTFDNACDTSCNNCTYKRTITHTYKKVTTKATLTKNGEIKNVCSVCGKVKSTEKIYYPKTITLSQKEFVYNGKVQTPTVTVKDAKGNELKKDTDYTVKLESGRKAVGKYNVKITFKGKYEGTKTLTYTINPKVTSKVSAVSSTKAIKLTWKKVTGADGYRIYQYNSKTKSWDTVKTLTGTSYKVQNLSSGTTYKFRIKAYAKDGGTIWGAATDTIIVATKPVTPKITKLTSSKGKAAFTWTNVSGESGYQVYYSTKKDSGFEKVKTYSANVTSGTKSKLTVGKTYYFKVRAYKTVDGEKVYSGWSSVKSIKIK